jgi:hypothetical protein
MWIESHQELRDHPKMKRAARMLAVSHREMVGMLHFLWWWAMDYAEDGNLSGYSAEDIAEAAGWEGEAGRFVTALVECRIRPDKHGFVEESPTGALILHDWYEYAGKLIERRETERDRQRRKRAAAKQHPTNGDQQSGDGGDALQQRTPDVAATTAGTVPNLTEPNLPTIPTGDPRAAAAAAPPSADPPPKKGERPKRQYTSAKAERLAKLAEAMTAAGLKSPRFAPREVRAAGDLMEAGWTPDQIAQCIKDIKQQRYLPGDRLAQEQVSCEFLAGFQRMSNWADWVEAGRPNQTTETQRNGSTRSSNARGSNGGAVASEEFTEQVSPKLAGALND